MSQLIGNYKLGELAALVKGEVNGNPEFTVTAAKDVAGNPLPEPLEASFITQEVYLVHLPIVLRSE